MLTSVSKNNVKVTSFPLDDLRSSNIALPVPSSMRNDLDVRVCPCELDQILRLLGGPSPSEDHGVGSSRHGRHEPQSNATVGTGH